MASFSQRLNELFGGQISGIQELNQKSAQAMQDAVASLHALVGRMEENSQRSGDTMAEKMANAVEEMERRQAGINEQTRIFVEGIREMVDKSQDETNAKLNEAISALSQQMSAMIGALQAQADKSHQEQQRREQDLADRTTVMVTDLGASVSEVAKQMAASTDQMRQSVTSLLHAVVGRIEENSQRSGDTMAEKMAKAVEEVERRQAEINEQTRIFVEGIREMVDKSQNETNAKLSEAISALSQQMTAMIGALQAQADKSHHEQQRREQDLADRTTVMVTDLGASVSEVVKQMAASTDQMRQSVTSLERTTISSIDKLNAGARTLEQGAIAFAQAGERVTGALGTANTVADKMIEVSGALTSSSTALQTVLSDYRANREATGSMLAELRSVVESAKKEASLTQQALDRIQSAATKLAQAQQETENYLEGVSEVLATAHSQFADGLSRTLDRANNDFHTKLSIAVKLLSSAVEELEVSISGATPSRR
jgi:transcriptional regulator of heat shock response